MTLSFGGTYTPALGEFLAIYFSDDTARVLGFSLGISNAVVSRARWYQDAVMPSTAAALNEGYPQFHIWGS